MVLQVLFVVNSPNTAVSWQAGTNQNVTWDVAGTDVNGINAKYVDIYLSTNGGTSFPILLKKYLMMVLR